MSLQQSFENPFKFSNNQKKNPFDKCNYII